MPDDFLSEDLQQAIVNATSNTLPQSKLTDALRTISNILDRRYLPLTVANRKNCLLDLLEISLRRVVVEKAAADMQQVVVKIIGQVALQLGEAVTAERRFAEMLQQMIHDQSFAPAARASACSTLALLVVLVGNLLQIEMRQLLATFRSLWTECSIGGHDQLVVAALKAWSLVLTMLVRAVEGDSVKMESILDPLVLP